jgi:hypothetical protein
MSPTSTKLPQHSTGWRALRIVSDRAAKGYKPVPTDWLRPRHREISLEEAAEIIKARLRIQRQVSQLHSRR